MAKLVGVFLRFPDIKQERRRTSILTGILSGLLLLLFPFELHATDVRVTDVAGETFTLHDAVTISYLLEGSGIAKDEVDGLKAQTATETVEFAWTDIRQIAITGPRQATVSLVVNTEQDINFDLQGITGQREGQPMTLNLDSVKTIEVMHP